MQFEKIDLENLLVIAGLVSALILAIFFSRTELSMSIASGLLGYIGGTLKGDTNKDSKGGDSK